MNTIAERNADFSAAAPSRGFTPAVPAALVPALLTAARIGGGLLFLQHGAQKLFGLIGGVDGAGAAVQLFSLMGAAGVLEFFGGLLVALGLFTRPVALLLALQMIIAYFMAHAPQGGLPIQNQGETALLFAAFFVILAGIGGGSWSLDGRLRARGR